MENTYSDLEITRNDSRILRDSSSKREKIRGLQKEKGKTGIVLSRRENFSWITTGGNSTVINSTHNGIGCLVITQDKHYFISHSMDGQRIIEEQLPGQGYELVELKWFETDPFEKALQIAGKNPAADIMTSSGQNLFSQVLDLHYPMTALEITRLGWVGKKMNEIYVQMGKFLRSGMIEQEIAAFFQYLQAQAGMISDVLIVGGDQRIFNYRHPMPGDNKAGKYLMLHSAPNKWGLHAPITRYFSFGPPGKELTYPFKAVATIQAGVFDMLRPGIPYSEIFEFIKGAYAQEGYPDEWQNHFQGGPTGYMIVDGQRLLSNKMVQEYMPFEWFSTVPGAKIAELTLLGNEKPEIVSCAEPWPQHVVELQDRQVKMPGIYEVN